MPHKTAPLTPRQLRANKAEKARKLLAGTSRRRDESDDEDEAWEWIYEQDGDESADEDGEEAASKKRKRRNVASTQERAIVGAKNGSFKCEIGDSVLLKAENGNPPWIGMILSFLEDEDGDMAADFMCKGIKSSFVRRSNVLAGFSSEKEIVNKTKKRSDFLPVSQQLHLWVQYANFLRMKCTSPLTQMLMLWLLSMEKLPSCPSRFSRRNTLLERSPRSRKIKGKRSYVEEDVILKALSIRTSLTGRIFSTAH
jgi:hypothetical protein